MYPEQIDNLEAQLEKHRYPLDVLRKFYRANPDEFEAYWTLTIGILRKRVESYEAFMADVDAKPLRPLSPHLTVLDR
ncbi:hypothetical protein HOD38_00720 [archaeon]|nr:hypothetical protein [archaeon]MBT4396768.1 hypothetical protein [archaeon]MBT4441378.1 hypothetical protein [archaeon]